METVLMVTDRRTHQSIATICILIGLDSGIDGNVVAPISQCKNLCQY